MVELGSPLACVYLVLIILNIYSIYLIRTAAGGKHNLKEFDGLVSDHFWNPVTILYKIFVPVYNAQKATGTCFDIQCIPEITRVGVRFVIHALSRNS